MQNLIKTFKSFILISFLFASCNNIPDTGNYENLVVVCGDSKVLMAKYPENKTDSIPQIVWSWDAQSANDLPHIYRTQKFNSVDDCKITPDKKNVMVSSSSGAIALVTIESKQVIFYADVPNAHSVEILPDNKLVAAASTANDGNKIMLFDLSEPDKLLDTDSLYSSHGVVWNSKRNSLFALGYDVLREYKIQNDTLNKIFEWVIPGIGGHDLSMAPDYSGMYITEHTGSWFFNFENQQFDKVENFPDAENIKSLNKNKDGQYIYTVPEESWWTFHVGFYNPTAKLSFPDIKVYKVRLFETNN